MSFHPGPQKNAQRLDFLCSAYHQEFSFLILFFFFVYHRLSQQQLV